MGLRVLSRGLLLSLGWTTAWSERILINHTADGRFQVVSQESGPLGDQGTIRGAGGWVWPGAAKDHGADAMRTWHIIDLPGAIPEAEAHGLKISSGIWLPHARERYEYCEDMEADPFWMQELSLYLETVRRFKNSSAILWWTVGNEVEMEVDMNSGTECLWRRLDWVAAKVKEEDPDHPVGFVLAGAHEAKVGNIARLCKSIDFLGINTYGDSSLTVGLDLLRAGWTKPFAIAEFGPRGHWESPLTNWDSYIEESSTQKAPRYYATCMSCKADPRCIGSFAFVWGWKWEKTGTWYGMFNEWGAVTENISVPCPGCESETVATMEECWTGSRRHDPPPSITAIEVGTRRLPGMRFSVERGELVPLHVQATHPLGHPLTAVWAVTEEVVSNAIGGAFEATNPLLSGLWNGSSEDLAVGLRTVLDTSRLPALNSFRLYVFVREQNASGTAPNQEASATLPFKLCHTAPRGSTCRQHMDYVRRVGVYADRGSYPGLSPVSPGPEVQMVLHQLGEPSCEMPCGLEEWCHTAAPWETCWHHVRWALAAGIQQSPENYPGLTAASTFEDVQMLLYRQGNGLCTRPCPGGPLEDKRDIHPGGAGDASASMAAWSSPLASLVAVLAWVVAAACSNS